MLFTSIAFLLFLTTAICIHFLIPWKFQWLWILVCSVGFYYVLSPIYLVLFILLILINYYFGLLIRTNRNKSGNYFYIALLFNILILCIFKFSGAISSFLPSSYSSNSILHNFILPIGLSYFTFNIISYLIEVKRGKVEPEIHVGIFASALLFFPKMLQGPIERPEAIFIQFKEKKSFDYQRTIEGLKQIAWGYLKKLVIADRLAIYVNSIYDNQANHNGSTLTFATILYAFQIYADFSGYTDIALGSAKIMGFNLSNNFKRPYFAISIKEFWNRWHISLSSWLRDYLFLPLAYYFSRKLKRTIYLGVKVDGWIYLFSALITFTVCGIWHGESLNYLFWGLLFGIYLSFANFTSGFNKRVRKKFNISKQSMGYKATHIIITFLFLLVSLAWVFFRSDTLAEGLSIISKIFTEPGPIFIGTPSTFFYSIFSVVLLVVIEWIQEFRVQEYNQFKLRNPFIPYAEYAMIIWLVLVLGVFDGGQFIYFKY